MKLRTYLGAAALVGVTFLVTSQVLSQDRQGKAKPGQPQAGEMPPEMQAWIEAAQPGPNHKHLDYSVGTWNTLARHWMAPDAPPMESQGKAVNKWVLGNRYVEMRYKGEFMGQPFEGIGYTGYDNIGKKYTSCWMDLMSTGITVENGSFDADKNQFTFHSEMDTPMGGKVKGKTNIDVVSNDKHVMTFYHSEPGGSELFKVMEITYTRAAGSAGSPEE